MTEVVVWCVHCGQEVLLELCPCENPQPDVRMVTDSQSGAVDSRDETEMETASVPEGDGNESGTPVPDDEHDVHQEILDLTRS